MEMRSSPAWLMTLELNGGEGTALTARGGPSEQGGAL
jgi:hypothetical protein